jgi:hypothetical protein
MSEPNKDATPSPADVLAKDQERLNALRAAFPDDPAFVLEQYSAGASVIEAQAAQAPILAEKLAASEKALKAAEKKAVAKPESKAVGVTPVGQGAPVPGVIGFEARVKELVAEGNTPDQAVSLAVREDPDRHMEFVRSHNAGRLVAHQLDMLEAVRADRGEG